MINNSVDASACISYIVVSSVTNFKTGGPSQKKWSIAFGPQKGRVIIQAVCSIDTGTPNIQEPRTIHKQRDLFIMTE
jgi:hypothetical protein